MEFRCILSGSCHWIQSSFRTAHPAPTDQDGRFLVALHFKICQMLWLH
jgi:hypothetical protein